MLCPRRCGVNRAVSRGYCGASDKMEVSKIMLHKWEEPCISGNDTNRGSGAVFFTHCPLGCIYCQNRDISGRKATGTVFTEAELAQKFIELEQLGAYNINLVTPTHYTDKIIETVSRARKNGLTIPIVWNTGGYELPEVIETLKGTVDIFLTDFKYVSANLSAEFSHAADYFRHCAESLKAMYRIAGKPEYDADGMMLKGVIVRHLVLPGCRNDSIAVLNAIAKLAIAKFAIAELVPVDEIKLSLMSQYTPDFCDIPESASDAQKKLKRRVTTFEYESVVNEALKLGFDGYIQGKYSATRRFTPDF